MTPKELFNLKFKTNKEKEEFFKEYIAKDEIFNQILKSKPEKILSIIFNTGYVLGIEDKNSLQNV